MDVVVIRTECDITSGEQLRVVFHHISKAREALHFVVPEGSPVERFGGCRELCTAGGVNKCNVRLLERFDGSGYVVANFFFEQMGTAADIESAWRLFEFMVKQDLSVSRGLTDPGAVK